jgi:ribonucleoside-diphosphate reductase alpha chain
MSEPTTNISSIRKRDGSVEPFRIEKVENAIRRAMEAVGDDAVVSVPSLAQQAVKVAEEQFPTETPSVEALQDIVEHVLASTGHTEAAKAYIIYRQRRADARQSKVALGVRDDLKLPINAIHVLERRYLMRDESGAIVETPRGMFTRVAQAVAAADRFYGTESDASQSEEEFYEMMSRLEFLPNSPTLMNAGTSIGQLSACFVLPIDDSMSDIFESVKNMALIHQSGGGTGFSFSRLRPKNDVVRSTGGVASGPVSFMQIFDTATDVVKQGGRRRGANMGVLSVQHPDIFEFITVKSRTNLFRNFNLSVAVTDEFMAAVAEGKQYALVNPRTGTEITKKWAQDVFELIVTTAWDCGDPGLIFIDEINRHNPTPEVGAIEATNPCGEQPLLPYESCNLGSVNLLAMMNDGEIDWDKLGGTVHKAVRFLDNVIDTSRFPLPRIEQLTKANRKIGLGVMGFAEMLIRMGIPYDADEALTVARRVMQFITDTAREASVELARERGSFPNFESSVWRREGYECLRNATVTSVAPTGTIGLIAGVSSGIEPVFALSYFRNIADGTRLLEQNALFEKAAGDRGFYAPDLMASIARSGSIRGEERIPEDVRRLFVTALDISPECHVKMQAAFQQYTDNGVSKTVNLPYDATVRDVRDAYLLAHKLHCKGVTVYRYGTRVGQTLYTGQPVAQRPSPTHPRDRNDEDASPTGGFVEVGPEYTGECKQCSP